VGDLQSMEARAELVAEEGRLRNLRITAISIMDMGDS
jgi:hypothetical protein